LHLAWKPLPTSPGGQIQQLPTPVRPAPVEGLGGEQQGVDKLSPNGVKWAELLQLMHQIGLKPLCNGDS
jgi:hypothetical protein